MRRILSKNKLIIVSTRLPVSVKKHNGTLSYKASSGGLATGVSYVSKSRDSIWVGWPGIASDELTAQDKRAITKELKRQNCHPVFLSQNQINLYYSGYCNATLWPLFHYFTNKTRHNINFWQSYIEVNKLFAKETAQFINNNSQTWVHDYQLMLLPELLRSKHKKAEIGFFLHTPFPSFEIFRLLPEREQLLRGLLGANLVGFHTYDYVRHFLSSVRRTLGYESHLGALQVEGTIVQTDAFPIGIDYKKFAKSSRKRAVKKVVKSIALSQDKTKVILAVDRADYSKGIPARLDAYECFLSQNPRYHGKVVLVLLAVPSRSDIDSYQELRETIEQKVSRINGAYSSVDWSPITYLHKSLPFDELTALYAMADVMLVTPLRDGMNLVAKEYIATKHKQIGVLVLSEMAGVASELPEALQVNPNNTEAVADSIAKALEMPPDEQRQRMRTMQKRISEYTIGRWAEDFLSQLATAKTGNSSVNSLSRADRSNLQKDYRTASSRLILLDYDGTLKEFVSSPSAAMARPSRRVKIALKKLSKDKINKIVIISGRPKNVLQSFFEDINLGLIAEHGGWMLDAGGWVKSSLSAKKWKKPIRHLIEAYTSRTPGSLIEEKDFSIVWHYRQVAPDLAYVRTQALRMELMNALSDSEIDVFEGQKILEVKPRRMHKGAIVTDMISEHQWDFIMAIGDDYTDEDIFAALPKRSYSIHVGSGETKAHYTLKSVSDVVKLIEDLSK